MSGLSGVMERRLVQIPSIAPLSSFKKEETNRDGTENKGADSRFPVFEPSRLVSINNLWGIARLVYPLDIKQYPFLFN